MSSGTEPPRDAGFDEVPAEEVAEHQPSPSCTTPKKTPASRKTSPQRVEKVEDCNHLKYYNPELENLLSNQGCTLLAALLENFVDSLMVKNPDIEKEKVLNALLDYNKETSLFPDLSMDLSEYAAGSRREAMLRLAHFIKDQQNGRPADSSGSEAVGSTALTKKTSFGDMLNHTAHQEARTRTKINPNFRPGPLTRTRSYNSALDRMREETWVPNSLVDPVVSNALEVTSFLRQKGLFMPSRFTQEFKNHEYLNSGGFGAAWRAVHKLDGQTWVIKLIHIGKHFFENERSVIKNWEKVMNEVQALAQLDHPNVVRYGTSWVDTGDIHIKPAEAVAKEFGKKSSKTKCLESLPEVMTMDDSEAEETEEREMESDKDDSEDFIDDPEDESDVIVEASIDTNAEVKDELNAEGKAGIVTRRPSPIWNLYGPPVENSATDGDADDEGASVENTDVKVVFRDDSEQLPSSGKNAIKISAGNAANSPKAQMKFSNAIVEDYPGTPPQTHQQAQALVTSSSPLKNLKDKKFCAKSVLGVIREDHSDSDDHDTETGNKTRARVTGYTLFIQMGYQPLDLQKFLMPPSETTPRSKRHCFCPLTSLRIYVQILYGVKYLHSQGLVHRDLKPANIFLAPSATAINLCCGQTKVMVPKIGDFGLVTDLGKSNEIVGTSTYAPPETWECSRGDGTAGDVWALGLILVELCQKFNTNSERKEVLGNFEKGAVSFYRRMSLKVDKRIEVIVEGCLRLKMAERWSVDEVIAETEKVMEELENEEDAAVGIGAMEN